MSETFLQMKHITKRFLECWRLMTCNFPYAGARFMHY